MPAYPAPVRTRAQEPAGKCKVVPGVAGSSLLPEQKCKQAWEGEAPGPRLITCCAR